MTAATATGPIPTQAGVEATIHAAIAHLADPEIPIISLSELGILRGVRTAADGVAEVVITPTYSGCPAMGQIEDDVHAALAQHGLSARVVTQLTPAWTTDWMSETAKEKLRAYGIARLTQHHRGVTLWLHRLQSAIPLPGLLRAVRLFQTLLTP